jgi:hypothetical protein
MRACKLLVRIVGVLSLLFAAFSVLVCALMAIGILISPPKDLQPYFYSAYAVIAGGTFLLSLLLGFAGWSLARLRTARWWLLAFVCITFYFFMHQIGALWLHPKFGMSIAAATGVGLGGLMPIEASYFYAWGPAIAGLCHALLRNRQGHTAVSQSKCETQSSLIQPCSPTGRSTQSRICRKWLRRM